MNLRSTYQKTLGHCKQYGHNSLIDQFKSRQLFSLCSFLILLPLLSSSQELKVMTYNIKYDNVHDTVNNWNDRKEAMIGLLGKHDASFIGMQEVLIHQLDYLNNALTEYDYIGVGRSDGKKAGEFSPIFYNTQEYELLTTNTFWLSKTPDKISVGWDAALERICTYGLFQNKKTKEKTWVFNTHFDHKGKRARRKSIELILAKIMEINKENLPVVLMGDFNLAPDEKPIQLVRQKMNDGRIVSKSTPTGPIGTFNGFDMNKPIERRIDYIFVKSFKVEN